MVGCVVVIAMAKVTVTDDSGNEYEVEESALEETFDIMNLSEHAEYVLDVRHNPDHYGYNYVADVKIQNITSPTGIWGGGELGSGGMGEWLDSHNITLDIYRIEADGAALKIYFNLEE